MPACPRRTDFTQVRQKAMCHTAKVKRTLIWFVDFELGLELDGAEVRGILLYEEREWGRVVFDMLS